MNADELKRLIEKRGYKVKSIQVYKNRHFRVNYQSSKFKAMCWHQWDIDKLDDKLFLRDFLRTDYPREG